MVFFKPSVLSHLLIYQKQDDSTELPINLLAPQGFILGPTLFLLNIKDQKLPSKGVLNKRCSENMQHIYRRKSMPMCDFNKIALQLRHGCSTVNLQHILRTPFPRNTSGRLLLKDILVTYSIAIYVDNTLICGNS